YTPLFRSDNSDCNSSTVNPYPAAITSSTGYALIKRSAGKSGSLVHLTVKTLRQLLELLIRHVINRLKGGIPGQLFNHRERHVQGGAAAVLAQPLRPANHIKRLLKGVTLALVLESEKLSAHNRRLFLSRCCERL